MVFKILSQNKNGTFCGTVNESVLINSSTADVWKIVGNFTGLGEWVEGVKKTESLSKVKNNFGAARKIYFADGGHVIEYAVGWKDGEYLSYIATSGLPLQGYHATITVHPKTKNSLVEWSSFLISNDSDKKQFLQFLESMGSFYAGSLVHLKEKLEKTK